MIVISAAGGREYALEDAKFSNGVFTYSIRKAFSKNYESPLTVFKLKEIVSKEVEQLTRGQQKPTSRKEAVNGVWIILDK